MSKNTLAKNLIFGLLKICKERKTHSQKDLSHLPEFGILSTFIHLLLRVIQFSSFFAVKCYGTSLNNKQNLQLIKLLFTWFTPVVLMNSYEKEVLKTVSLVCLSAQLDNYQIPNSGHGKLHPTLNSRTDHKFRRPIYNIFFIHVGSSYSL